MAKEEAEKGKDNKKEENSKEKDSKGRDSQENRRFVGNEEKKEEPKKEEKKIEEQPEKQEAFEEEPEEAKIVARPRNLEQIAETAPEAKPTEDSKKKTDKRQYTEFKPLYEVGGKETEEDKKYQTGVADRLESREKKHDLRERRTGALPFGEEEEERTGFNMRQEYSTEKETKEKDYTIRPRKKLS